MTPRTLHLVTSDDAAAEQPQRTRRRDRAFGNVRKLPSGRWQARWLVDGKQQGVTFRTKTEATAHLATVQAAKLRGQRVDQRAGRQTFGHYAEAWLARRTDLRPVTRAKYQHMLERHVLPVLGSYELAKLTPSAVRSWYLDLRQRYVTTGDDAYRMLRAILTTAVDDGIIAASPCKVKGAGQTRSVERPILSVAELTAAAAAAPEHHRLAVLLPAWCQLRRGEVIGLQRRDVDLLRGTIHVERAVVRPMNGSTVVGAPKTAAGTRTLAVPANVLPALTEHLERFVGPEPEAWLFTARDGGPMVPVTLNRIWQRARRAIGRADVFYHDLRHSGLTWAAQAGATLPELMRRGGHASPPAALRYQHATDDRDRALAEKLGQMA